MGVEQVRRVILVVAVVMNVQCESQCRVQFSVQGWH
jgi:hypothetical protein